jgi:Response regulators consisting of a CheY-like receiver domain and a winged-helix DNA-binding domain
MQRIFIVEDDDSIRDMVVYALSSSGYFAAGFPDGGAFWQGMEQGAPDLLLLDIMLPDEDGIAILAKLRKSGRFGHVPVIMLTARGTEYDRVKGLDLGADDYVTKPFSILELHARIKAVLRRTGADEAQGQLAVGAVVLHPQQRRVFADGQEITLTYKEFELLHYLMRNEGIVLSREQMLEQVWGFDYGGESRTVDMHIKSLRQKLGEGGSCIKTVRNVGYKVGG